MTDLLRFIAGGTSALCGAAIVWIMLEWKDVAWTHPRLRNKAMIGEEKKKIVMYYETLPLLIAKGVYVADTGKMLVDGHRYTSYYIDRLTEFDYRLSWEGIRSWFKYKGPIEYLLEKGKINHRKVVPVENRHIRINDVVYTVDSIFVDVVCDQDDRVMRKRLGLWTPNNDYYVFEIGDEVTADD
jgi:hypothetical protein